MDDCYYYQERLLSEIENIRVRNNYVVIDPDGFSDEYDSFENMHYKIHTILFNYFELDIHDEKLYIHLYIIFPEY